MSELYQDAISDLQHSELLDPIRTPDRRSPEHESGEADKNLSYFFPTGDDATAGGASADEEAGVPAKPSWYAVVFMVRCCEVRAVALVVCTRVAVRGHVHVWSEGSDGVPGVLPVPAGRSSLGR